MEDNEKAKKKTAVALQYNRGDEAPKVIADRKSVV